jgi:hypothetical protein
MDISHAKTLTAPPIRALAAPVYWEPLPGSGERVCAMILLAPEIDTSVMLTPAAHVVINPRRLRQMLGAERGESARGILAYAAEFMTRRLHADSELAACTPPFSGLSVGSVKLVKGFTTEQVLDAAVHSMAVFGSAQDLIDEGATDAFNSTATTREFLARVQTAFAPANDERRQRFLKRVPTIGSDTVTIDYAHNGHLVQFASAPTTERQWHNMRREGEAKMLQALTVQQLLADKRTESNFKPCLMVNVSPLFTDDQRITHLNISREGMAHYQAIAKLHRFELTEVQSHEAAVHALMALD